ncbi:MAG: methyltransferase domain-containing protein [Luminiphilus sp.]|nr:methyltransferase domain-containing protein [Luminiphilus sp.]
MTRRRPENRRAKNENGQFNLCTSTEVFEHVADDKRGFSEIRRVLRPMGMLVFSVPLTDSESTLQRTVTVGDQTIHLGEPEYHGDAISGQGQLLAHCNYGADVLSLPLEVGFSDAWIDESPINYFHGVGRQIILAQN